MIYLGRPCRPHHFKFFKGCLPQVLHGPFLNTLTHLIANGSIKIPQTTCFWNNFPAMLISTPPKSVLKSFWHFIGAQKWNIDVKWVNYVTLKKHFHSNEKAISETWTGTLKNLDPEKRGNQLDVEKWLEDHI